MFESSMMSTGWGYVGTDEKGFEWLFTPDPDDPCYSEDPRTGEWKATYATFKKVGGEWPYGIWQYCGHCFRGENVERGKDPVYC